MFFLNLKLTFMKKKAVVGMIATAMLLSGAIYAGTSFFDRQVDTNCQFTGDMSQSCSYAHGGTNYRVLNCLPNGNDCSFNVPTVPVIAP
jgi:type 1 fimbria pilin